MRFIEGLKDQLKDEKKCMSKGMWYLVSLEDCMEATDKGCLEGPGGKNRGRQEMRLKRQDRMGLSWEGFCIGGSLWASHHSDREPGRK